MNDCYHDFNGYCTIMRASTNNKNARVSRYVVSEAVAAIINYCFERDLSEE